MKKTRIKNGLKLGVFALFMLAFSAVSAQSTSDVAKGSTAVKVIDNKGTIKYFQSNNGITQIVNTTADVTTTTWQLGGTLTDDTYIDASGAVFALDGIALVDIATESAADSGDVAADHTGSGVGYTLLVRDEATAETKKLLVSDLIDVLWAEETLSADETSDFTIAAVGMLATTDARRVSVYRNGAKLRAGTDYEITTVDVVDIKVAEFVQAYDGDVFEVHFIK